MRKNRRKEEEEEGEDEEEGEEEDVAGAVRDIRGCGGQRGRERLQQGYGAPQMEC